MHRELDDSGLGWGPDRHIFRRKVTLGPSLWDIPPSYLLSWEPGNQALGRRVFVCVCVCAPLPSSLSSNVHPHNLDTQLLTCNTSGLPEERR